MPEAVRGRPPAVRAAGVVAPAQRAAVRGRIVRRGLVPRRPVHRRGARPGACWPSSAGCSPTAAGSACSSSSPPAPCHRRCRRATSFPTSARWTGCSPRPGSGSPTPPTPTWPTARGVEGPGRRRRRGGGAPARRRPGLGRGRGAVRSGRPAALGRRAPRLAGVATVPERLSALIAGCKETLAKSSLHSYSPVMPVDEPPLEPAGPGDRRPRAPRARPSAAQPTARSVRVNGPATAGQLGRALDESSGSTSYHLRRLADYGFVEEVEGLGTARERWWRARHRMTSWQAADLVAQEGGVGGRGRDEPPAARPARPGA